MCNKYAYNIELAFDRLDNQLSTLHTYIHSNEFNDISKVEQELFNILYHNTFVQRRLLNAILAENNIHKLKDYQIGVISKNG